MGFANEAKGKAYYKKWRSENKKWIHDYNVKWREANKEKILRYSREWSRKQPKGSRRIHEVVCGACSKIFRAQNKTQRFCSHRCHGASQIPKGYKRYRHNGKVMLLHRYLMEQKLGRKLKHHTIEIVHHINGNKHDNRIENLQLMNSRHHDVMHALDREAKKRSVRHSEAADRF